MSPETLARLGLERLEIVELSCRRTTCRLVYEYPTALLDLVERRGLPPDSPLVLIFEERGPAASSFGGNGEDVMVRDGERYARQWVVMGFDEAARDPRKHAEWANAGVPRIKQVIERIRRRWEQKRARASSLGRDSGS
jgi:hypothetical protein